MLFYMEIKFFDKVCFFICSYVIKINIMTFLLFSTITFKAQPLHDHAFPMILSR